MCMYDIWALRYCEMGHIGYCLIDMITKKLTSGMVGSYRHGKLLVQIKCSITSPLQFIIPRHPSSILFFLLDHNTSYTVSQPVSAEADSRSNPTVQPSPFIILYCHKNS